MTLLQIVYACMIIADILLFNVYSVFIHIFLKLKNKPWTFRKADSGPSLIPLTVHGHFATDNKKGRTRAFNSLLLSVDIFTEDYTNKRQTAIAHY